LATLTPAALAALPLRPHPAARWIAFATLPFYTIWRRHREALPLDADLSWVGEAVLISRPADAVAWQAIGAAAVAFLDASAECEPFAVAANAAASADPADAIDAWLPALVRAGAFGPVAGLR
jgi:hypothetical protein